MDDSRRDRDDGDGGDDNRAAMKIVGVLLMKLGGAVEVTQADLEALDGYVLLVDDFDFNRPLRLRLAKVERTGS